MELGRVLPGVHLSLSALHIHHKGLEKWGVGSGVGVLSVTSGGRARGFRVETGWIMGSKLRGQRSEDGEG